MVPRLGGWWHTVGTAGPQLSWHGVASTGARRRTPQTWTGTFPGTEKPASCVSSWDRHTSAASRVRSEVRDYEYPPAVFAVDPFIPSQLQYYYA